MRCPGLRRLFEQDDARRLNPAQVRRILIDLDLAFLPTEMDRPGYRLHRLQGDRHGDWSVRVSEGSFFTYSRELENRLSLRRWRGGRRGFN